MKVLVACEFSGVVRDALIGAGVDAVSCDLLASERPGPHRQGDVRAVLALERWDAVLGFPPCTDLAVSGARWWAAKGPRRREEALAMVDALWNGAPVVALENPVGRLSSLWRLPDQTFQPWQFGDLESKRTCLWLRGLPPLLPGWGRPAPDVDIEARVHRMGPGPERARERSRTYAGVAAAIAAQWGPLLA